MKSTKKLGCRVGLSCFLFSGLLAVCGNVSPTAAAAGKARDKAAHETLVWSDEFNGTAPRSAPNPRNWTYDTGASGWGNRELETYCAYGSATAPCDPANPNAYVGNDGYLHIAARNPADGVYTSARMKSQGLQSFQYGRLEARIKVPKGQGFWSAFWTLGDNVSTVGWPACGEMDIMESLGKLPSTNFGSVHGTGFTGGALVTEYHLPDNTRFGDDFHTYGIVWSPGKVEYYVDRPANVYATYTPKSLPAGAIWPFDSGKAFILLNLAVGGEWPGPPDATSVFPQEMLVDYVRVYSQTSP